MILIVVLVAIALFLAYRFLKKKAQTLSPEYQWQKLLASLA